jgi:hypothetical protein
MVIQLNISPRVALYLDSDYVSFKAGSEAKKTSH